MSDRKFQVFMIRADSEDRIVIAADMTAAIAADFRATVRDDPEITREYYDRDLLQQAVLIGELHVLAGQLDWTGEQLYTMFTAKGAPSAEAAKGSPR